MTRKNTSLYPPPISFQKAQSSFFIYDKQVYSVEHCSTDIFKMAVRARHPGVFRESAADNLLERDSLDVVTKWYILCECKQAQTPLRLYASESLAHMAIARNGL